MHPRNLLPSLLQSFSPWLSNQRITLLEGLELKIQAHLVLPCTWNKGGLFLVKDTSQATLAIPHWLLHTSLMQVQLSIPFQWVQAPLDEWSNIVLVGLVLFSFSLWLYFILHFSHWLVWMARIDCNPLGLPSMWPSWLTNQGWFRHGLVEFL